MLRKDCLYIDMLTTQLKNGKSQKKNPQKLQMSFLILSFSGLFTERAETVQNFSGKHKDSKY